MLLLQELRYTLVSDGSSDAALLPILDWLLIQNGVDCAIQSAWADLRRLASPIKGIRERIRKSVELFPCELLFVHRDAEKETRDKRLEEVNMAYRNVQKEMELPQHICVVPVRMTEAWLLFDEQAIRHAAGNRSGKQKIQLPRLQDLESVPNPKKILFELILNSSGLSGRRRKRLNVHYHAYRVSSLVEDFSPLRTLPAFSALENDIGRFLNTRT